MSAMDSEPSRLDRAAPSAPTSSGMWAKPGASAPSASKISIWAPVLVTWSSPRITWVIFMSMSSTTDGRV